jgi:DNA-binding beta-propeller fold protein YncE
MKKMITAISLLILSMLLLSGYVSQTRLARPGVERSWGLPDIDGPAATGDWLYVLDQGRVTVVDSTTGKRVRELPAGVPAPDWSTLYAVERRAGQTTVRAIDVATGEPVRAITLVGDYDLIRAGLNPLPRGLSPNGRWLALEALPGPESPEVSRFVVLDTAFTQPPRLVKLEGIFWFDALNNAGTALYLIEDLSAQYPTQYQVRLYDLAQGALTPGVIADKRGDGVMRGTYLSSVPSPTGEWLYSLYVKDDHLPFIHALNLDQRFAVCIFLPSPGEMTPKGQMAWSLAITADGSSLYAANSALGVVSDVSPTQFTVRRTTQFDLAGTGNPFTHLSRRFVRTVEADYIPASSSITLSPDGQILFVAAEKGLLAVNTRDLSLGGYYLADWTLDGFALSADGARLYAGSAQWGKIVQLEPATGKIVGEIAGAGRPRHVLWAEAK